MTPRRTSIVRALPRSYHADAPTLSPARQTAASGHHSPHGTTGASPALATPAPADDAVSGERGLISSARHAAGFGARAYLAAAKRITRAQQLRAARIIFGRPVSA